MIVMMRLWYFVQRRRGHDNFSPVTSHDSMTAARLPEAL